MRAVAVSVWIFINLVFVGMCGYIYLLWSQYWNYVERQHTQITGAVNNNAYASNNQVLYFNNGSPTDSLSSSSTYLRSHIPNKNNRTIPRHHIKEKRYDRIVKIINKDNKPRFPKIKFGEVEVKPLKNSKSDRTVTTVYMNDKLAARVATYKNQLVVQLRRVLLEESSVFKARGDASNPYDVQYMGPKGSYQGKSVYSLICQLKQKTSVKVLRNDQEPFNKIELGTFFPKIPLLHNSKQFNTCAIVTNAGSLYGSNLGKFIDSHDVVLRFNHAPTKGYEDDVGNKTTIRIINSQVISKPEFNFLKSDLYTNVELLVWDPSNYTSSLKQGCLYF